MKTFACLLLISFGIVVVIVSAIILLCGRKGNLITAKVNPAKYTEPLPRYMIDGEFTITDVKYEGGFDPEQFNKTRIYFDCPPNGRFKGEGNWSGAQYPIPTNTKYYNVKINNQ